MLPTAGVTSLGTSAPSSAWRRVQLPHCSEMAGCRTLQGVRIAMALVSGSIVMRAKRSGMGAMSELLLQLRSASAPEREELLREEDVKGLKAICAGLGRPTGGTAEEVLHRIQEVLQMEDNLYHGITAGVIEAVGRVAEEKGDVLTFLGRSYKVADLKELCGKLGLPQSGRKALLADRIASKAVELWQVMKLRGSAATSAQPSSQTVESVVAEGVAAEPVPVTSTSRRTRPAEVEEVLQAVREAWKRLDMLPLDSSSPFLFGSWKEMPLDEGDASRVSDLPPAQEPLEAEVVNGEVEFEEDDDPEDEEDEEEEDEIARKERRFRERRHKLMGYVVEENATVYGEQKQRYLQDLNAALQDMTDAVRHSYLTDKMEAPILDNRLSKVLGPPRDTAEYAAWHVEPYSEEMHMVGELGPARVAYCKWWDRARGCGEVVDTVDKGVAAVLAAALTTGANVAPTAKYLVQGEMVEYRRVKDAEVDRGILVRGVRGWPLTCEMDGAKALPG